MATILKTEKFINVSGIAADVSHATIFSVTDAVKVKRLSFIAGSDADFIVLKYNADDEAEIARLGAANAEEQSTEFFGDNGSLMKIFIDFSACTLNANHKLIIELA